MKSLVTGVCSLLSLSVVSAWGGNVIPANTGAFGPSTQHPVEAHHSLHPPLDKSQVYWSFGGSTVLTRNLIRLTPSTQDRRGWIWNEYPLETEWFEVEMKMEVYSKPHFGGDGMAMWIVKPPAADPTFTQQPDALIGPIFGMKHDFNGIGILFDVYDNDGKRNNPSIFAVANLDGKPTSFNHDNDFENDMITTKPDNVPLSPAATYSNHRCVADFRNTGKPSKVLVRWLHHILHVYVDTSDGMGYKFCLAVKIPDAQLASYHLAFTSATGQVADNMDILEVSTRYLAQDDADTDDSKGVHLGTGSTSSIGAGWGGVYWTLINLGGLGLLGVMGWTIHTLKTLLAARLDAVFICARINPVIVPHYAVHAAVTVLLLIGGFWWGFLANLPLIAWRAYEYQRHAMLLNAPMLVASKGHSTPAGLSIQTVMYITMAWYVVLQIYYTYRWIW